MKHCKWGQEIQCSINGGKPLAITELVWNDGPQQKQESHREYIIHKHYGVPGVININNSSLQTNGDMSFAVYRR